MHYICILSSPYIARITTKPIETLTRVYCSYVLGFDYRVLMEKLVINEF